MLSHSNNFAAHFRSCTRRAFTLTEMLISVALVVVLMLAVTQIFSIASRTLSSGQALGATIRDGQAAQSVFSHDIGSTNANGPCLLIRSTRKFAFRNKDDALSDLDANPGTYDRDGTGTEAALGTVSYNLRNHRLDYLMLFASDRFNRQTANNGGPLVANQSSNSAAIFFHHLDLADNNGTFSANTFPAAGNITTNPNNFFANQWTLGRFAALMVEPTALGPTGVITDSEGNNQQYIYRPTTGDTLAPLAADSDATTGGGVKFFTGRYDLVGRSTDSFRGDLINYITAKPAATWWLDLMLVNRFQATPFVVRPLNAATASQQVPIFVQSCSQFMVDYAGDYLTQNADGSLDTTAPNGGVAPDGFVDFVGGSGKIRWYGLPRDTNNDGKIIANDGDVVPLRDIAGGGFSFERTFPTPNKVSTSSNYMTESTLTADPQYIVAWGPGETNRPKMLRITLGIDRPEGQLVGEQTFEYVFNVGF